MTTTSLYEFNGGLHAKKLTRVNLVVLCARVNEQTCNRVCLSSIITCHALDFFRMSHNWHRARRLKAAGAQDKIDGCVIWFTRHLSRDWSISGAAFLGR